MRCTICDAQLNLSERLKKGNEGQFIDVCNNCIGHIHADLGEDHAYIGDIEDPTVIHNDLKGSFKNIVEPIQRLPWYDNPLRKK
jgi:hypothetical protein